VAEYRRLLAGVPGIAIPFGQHPGTSACHLFPILVDAELDRRSFMERMRRFGIQTSIHYPPIHQFSFYRERFGDQTDGLAVTDEVGTREVTLPLYPGMSLSDVKTVCNAVCVAV
jgi:dTDP-4-amino-4,6-dideoxygalactose transaminase